MHFLCTAAADPEGESSDEESRAIFTPKLSWGAAFTKVKKALVLRSVATNLVAAASDHARSMRGDRDALLAGLECAKHARVGDSFGELELLTPKPGARVCLCWCACVDVCVCWCVRS